MEEILHANIFFFVTGIAVIATTALLCVVLFHTIKVLKSLRRVLTRIENEADAFKDDMAQVRAYFAQDGLLRKLVVKLFGKRDDAKKEESQEEEVPRRKSALKIKDQK